MATLNVSVSRSSFPFSFPNFSFYTLFCSRLTFRAVQRLQFTFCFSYIHFQFLFILCSFLLNVFLHFVLFSCVFWTCLCNRYQNKSNCSACVYWCVSVCVWVCVSFLSRLQQQLSSCCVPSFVIFPDVSLTQKTFHSTATKGGEKVQKNELFGI